MNVENVIYISCHMECVYDYKESNVCVHVVITLQLIAIDNNRLEATNLEYHYKISSTTCRILRELRNTPLYTFCLS